MHPVHYKARKARHGEKGNESKHDVRLFRFSQPSDRYSERYAEKAEPVFPPALMLDTPSAVAIVGESVTWHCPTSLRELLRLKEEFPEARIVAGNTEVCFVYVSCACVRWVSPTKSQLKNRNHRLFPCTVALKVLN